MTEAAVVVAEIDPVSEAARRQRDRRRFHWQMLIVSALATVLSFALTIRSDGRVAPRFLTDVPVPELCPSHLLFGFDCPACGLTRSFIALSQADLSTSLHYHRLGMLVAIVVLFQLPYRAICLMAGRCLPRRMTSLFGYLLIACLVVNWMLPRIWSSPPDCPHSHGPRKRHV